MLRCLLPFWIFGVTGLFLPLTTQAAKPNIVFMVADDLGWADVEFHGGNVPTPNLNQLLSEGVELEQHYVAPVCSPTRAGFLTGRYGSRFGITTPTNELALPRATTTVASLLREAGYTTCLSGKWHLGSKPKWGPNHFGFDHSYGSLAGGVAPWNHHYKKGPYSVTWHRNETLLDETGHVTDLLADEAVNWLGENAGPESEQPFFLYVPFTAVHLPIREPEEWLQRVPAKITGAVDRQYAACILHLDSAVGRIVTAIEAADQTNNTLLIFTSDNGGSTAENNDTKYPDDHCPNGRLPGNNSPLRGQKATLYEGGIRVPTIARWPGQLEAGSKFRTPVCIVDWMPTIAALGETGADGQDLKWDGKNLWPALTTGAELPERSLYLAGPRFRSQALRDGDWKLIVSAAAKQDGEERVELFNLADDSEEKNNIAGAHPQRVAELKRKLSQAAQNDRDAVASASAGS